MSESGHRTEVINRTGCIAMTSVAALFLLIAVAISLGWLGQVDRNKETVLPVAEGTQD